MDSSYDSLMKSKGYLPFRMGCLTDWMINKAKKELNETEEIRAQAMTELRRLIANDKKLDVWTDDSYLLQFLRVRKFQPDKAMEVIQNLYALFEDFSDVYPKNLDLDRVKLLIPNGSGGAFPYRHRDGGVICFLKYATWDPDEFEFEIAASALIAMILSFAEDPATQVCGVHLIYDAKINFKHLRYASRRYLQLYGKLARNTLPIRFNGIYMVNESVIFKYIFSIMKLFLSEKIKKRIHFCGSDLTELHKHIPKECLPLDYGGDNSNYSVEDFNKREFEPFLGRFKEMLNRGYTIK